MSNGFHASLSGSRRPSNPHHHQKQHLIEANLLELGLVGRQHQKKNKKTKRRSFFEELFDFD